MLWSFTASSDHDSSLLLQAFTDAKPCDAAGRILLERCHSVARIARIDRPHAARASLRAITLRFLDLFLALDRVQAHTIVLKFATAHMCSDS